MAAKFFTAKRKSRVVLIDDDVAFCQIISLAAANNNWIVTCFNSFEEADALSLKDADVLVLDYDLGLLNGLEIGRRLARRRFDAPILLVSANQEAFGAGDWPENITRFTSKSVGPFGVVESINQLLYRQELQLA